jgi:hypothetical protein
MTRIRRSPRAPPRGHAGSCPARQHESRQAMASAATCDACQAFLLKQDLRCLASLDQQVISRLLMSPRLAKLNINLAWLTVTGPAPRLVCEWCNRVVSSPVTIYRVKNELWYLFIIIYHSTSSLECMYRDR